MRSTYIIASWPPDRRSTATLTLVPIFFQLPNDPQTHINKYGGSMLPKKRGETIWTQKNFGHKNRIFGQKFFDNKHSWTKTFYVKNLFWLNILICVKKISKWLLGKKIFGHQKLLVSENFRAKLITCQTQP